MTKPIKEKLPNIEAVEKQLDEVLEVDLADFLKSTNLRRDEVIGSRRFALLAFLFAFAVMMALYYVSVLQSTLISSILIGCTMIWLTIVLLSGRQWLTSNKLLAKEMSMALVPVLTNTLDRMLMYTHDADHREETRQLLTESKLLTTAEIEVVSDDMYSAYGDNEVSFRELFVTKQLKSSNSKEKVSVELFKGVFVIARLGKTHSAETYVSTDSDKTGFAHKTFWTNLLGSTPVKETILEWNDFENHLHVASSDPTAAREILTPEFMQDLYDWWQEHKLNIRISFKDDKMFMLLPESSVHIGYSTTSTKPKAIRRYVWSLVQPMWRSLTLIEDVPK